MLRIALGGISHESNTFNPIHTGLEDFNIIRGEGLLELRVSRFLLNAGADVIPTIYARTLPSGTLRYDAYVRMRDELVERLHEAGRVNGVCLILHGAMEVEKIEDGEGNLVKAVHETIGEKPIISASLDLHGNISPRLLEKIDILTAYRTAPHVDVEETRIRAAGLLIESLRNNLKPKSFMVKPPVLLLGELVVTDIKPALSLYGQLGKIDGIEGDPKFIYTCRYGMSRQPECLCKCLASPSFTKQILSQLEYKRIKRPLYPLDEEFSWKPPH